ncbi:MAG TPA: hypothetical protein DEB39_16160 [Planctomycetaceae bacterium]|nr:hypothetical protein [Planctomycetaceae bacterium]
MPATVPAAVQPRTAQVSSAGGDTKTSLLLFTGSLLGGGLLGLLIAGAIIGYLSITHVPPGTVPDGGASTVVLSPSSPAKPAVGTLDHVLIDRDIRRFAFVSAPDTELRLSSDGNPMQAKDDASAALDDLSAVLQAEGSVSMEPHDVSLKIEAKGKGTFALSRTLGENGDCTTDSIDAIRLCLLMPETANANVDAATYGDPPGPFELAEFRLRLGQGSDYIELSPKSFSDFAVRHARARQNWIDLTIPVAGDDQWAVAGSSQKPRQIQWIELRGKPSGSAVTFWIDNLKLTGK